MDHDGSPKAMSHLSSMCQYSNLSLQVLFYNGRDSHFDDSVLIIIQSHYTQYFILE